MSRPTTLLALALASLTTSGLFGQDAKTVPADGIRRALEQELKLDYAGAMLEEVIAQLQTKTKIRFHVDTLSLALIGFQNDQGVSFRGEGKVRQVLQRLLSPYNLTYVQLEDTLFITTPDQGFQRQMQQRVPLEVKKQPLEKALQDLARATGVNLVVDPRMAKEAQSPVSLQLDDATVETSVRLLAEIGGMKAVRMGNVLFVTSEDRAERIRKEEPPQPQPMNGMNLPNVGAAAGGIFQGAFGGIGVLPALPANPAVPAPPPAPEQKDANPAPKEP